MVLISLNTNHGHAFHITSELEWVEIKDEVSTGNRGDITRQSSLFLRLRSGVSSFIKEEIPLFQSYPSTDHEVIGGDYKPGQQMVV